MNHDIRGDGTSTNPLLLHPFGPHITAWQIFHIYYGDIKLPNHTFRSTVFSHIAAQSYVRYMTFNVWILDNNINKLANIYVSFLYHGKYFVPKIEQGVVNQMRTISRSYFSCFYSIILRTAHVVKTKTNDKLVYSCFHLKQTLPNLKGSRSKQLKYHVSTTRCISRIVCVDMRRSNGLGMGKFHESIYSIYLPRFA